mmetsp:Transcript_34819/g.73428  ORF Transcript_34819/g.73428 Transcript_34819/m.73428 type:complete len:210 (+) Transcript_34819:2334-2963(+)
MGTLRNGIGRQRHLLLRIDFIIRRLIWLRIHSILRFRNNHITNTIPGLSRLFPSLPSGRRCPTKYLPTAAKESKNFVVHAPIPFTSLNLLLGGPVVRQGNGRCFFRIVIILICLRGRAEAARLSFDVGTFLRTIPLRKERSLAARVNKKDQQRGEFSYGDGTLDLLRPAVDTCLVKAPLHLEEACAAQRSLQSRHPFANRLDRVQVRNP